jgi:predicted nucleic acid-binding protein
MPFVLDASVAVAWAFEDEKSPYPNHVLEMLATDIARVPPLWTLEVANALLAAERRQRIRIAKTVRFIALIQGLPVVVSDLAPERDLGAVLDLGRSQVLSTYDASYLELAMREGIPLATQDDRLRSAAQRLLVPLI